MKNNFLCIILTLIILSILIFLVGFDNTTFSGSKTKNDNQYLIDFDILNTTLYSSMTLLKGEAIETSINIIKGKVDIVVVNENGTIAYEGKDVETCNFKIDIKESGTYTFYITGYKSKGHVYFKKCEMCYV